MYCSALALESVTVENASDLLSKCRRSFSRETVVVPRFTKLRLYENVCNWPLNKEVLKGRVKQGIFAHEVIGDKWEEWRLVLRDTNDCNLHENTDFTKVYYYTTPNILRSEAVQVGCRHNVDGVLATYQSLKFSISESLYMIRCRLYQVRV